MNHEVFVITIILIAVFGSLLVRAGNNWMRMRHGYAPEALGRGGRGQASSDLAELRASNEKLTLYVERLEQRMRVLERLATDRAPELAAEIERLRVQPTN
jgi:cell division protein FtsB